MTIDDSQIQEEAELLSMLIASEGWKVFAKYVRVLRTSNLDYLASERDTAEIYRYQGAVNALAQVLELPAQAIKEARNAGQSSEDYL